MNLMWIAPHHLKYYRIYSPMVTIEHNSNLMYPICFEEVEKIIKYMALEKSPGSHVSIINFLRAW